MLQLPSIGRHCGHCRYNGNLAFIHVLPISFGLNSCRHPMNSVLDWRHFLVRSLHGSLHGILVSIVRRLNGTLISGGLLLLREASSAPAPLPSPLPTQASWRAPQSPKSSGPATTACGPILWRSSLAKARL